jgi:hypothetical protein
VRREPPRLTGMLTRYLTRASALLLGAAGLALLFAADDLLPWLAPGTPTSGAWVGQVLGATLLALAWLNWLHQRTLLGGIYGRPVVLPNVAFYFISALSVLRAASRPESSSVILWTIGGFLGIFALAYGWLLYRGPLERDLAAFRASGT